MNRANLYLISLLLLLSGAIQAQITQTIRGKVIDKESKFPLIGVNVYATGSDGQQIGAVTDENGKYRINEVPIGRTKVVFSYIGYNDVNQDNIIVSSAKEVILNVELEEAAMQLHDVVVVAKKRGEVRNEMAVISAREFTVSETEKYAGSRGDPARMARNFAGVLASDDSRNDIVVRGNTPLGVLWRIEGINVPNPNHFAIPGTGGGSVTILNNKFLANSDFFTGAFPAEYGNAIAGAFDLRMRNGNNEKHEFSTQFGILGTELMAEGPIQKGNSSYLAMYRYSTIAIFHKLGINIGTDASPKYQDGAFRLNFPQKNGGSISFFGMGGVSNIDIIKSTLKDTSKTELYGSNDRDQYFGSRMGVLGLSYAHPINNKSFVKLVVSASHQRVYADHDKVFNHIENGQFELDSLTPILHYTFTENKYSAYLSYNKKFSRQLSMKAGLNFDLLDTYFIDSVRAVQGACGKEIITPWRKRWDGGGNPMLIQPYVQFKYKANNKLTLTGGLTSLAYTISPNAKSLLEPRLGLSYLVDPKSKINFALGLHSQNFASYLYYYDKNTDYKKTLNPYNKDLGLMKSFHAVLGYSRSLGNIARFKVETYYQYLYNLPVGKSPNAYSLINSGSGFSRFFPDTLTNGGIGRNYGIDFTLEKGFSRGYFFLLTGSLFDAKYRGSDGIWRNSAFNGQYALNAAGGKEIKFGNRQSLNLSGRMVWSGGQRYGIVDHEASVREQEIVYKDEKLNEFKFKDYFRVDFKVNYKINTYNLTHEIGIDFNNALNIKNVLRYSYVPCLANPVVEEYQLGFLPIFYYKLDF